MVVPRLLCELVVRQLGPLAPPLRPTENIPLIDQEAFFEAAAAKAGDSNLGLSIGAALPRGAFDVPEYVVRSAQTWGEAVYRYVQIAPRVFGPVLVDRSVSRDGVTLTLEVPGHPFALGAHANALFAAALVKWGRELVGPAFRLTRACFPHPAPADREAYVLSICAHTQFGAPVLQLVFPNEVAALPLNTADETLLRLLEKTLGLEAPAESEDLLARVMGLMNDALPNGPPHLEFIAARMGWSGRTLQRQLSQRGLSYQKLVDQLRERKARELLVRPGLALQQVAERLGYSEVAAFIRAFRRWTGQTPGEFRGNLEAHPSG